MDKAARGFLWDNLLCMSVYWASAGTVIASLADYYALPLALISFITGLTATLPIMQLWGGLHYARTRRRSRFLGLTNSLWRVLLPLTFVSVLLPRDIGKIAAVCTFSIGVAVFQFAAPAQTEWMVTSVEGKVRVNYYSLREMCFMLAYSVIFCLINLLLDGAQRSGAIGQAFLAVGGLLMLVMVFSLIVLARLPYPPDRPDSVVETPSILHIALSDGPFRKVVLANALWSFACVFVGSFAAVYQVGVLHVRFLQIMLWATAANVIRALLTPGMAVLADRIGWRKVVCGCMLLYAVTALLWSRVTAPTAPWLYPVVTILTQIPIAGTGVGFFQLQVEAAPPQHRSICFSMVAACSGAGALVGTVISSTLVRFLEQNADFFPTLGLRGVFLLGALGACLAAASVLRIRAQPPVYMTK